MSRGFVYLLVGTVFLVQPVLLDVAGTFRIALLVGGVAATLAGAVLLIRAAGTGGGTPTPVQPPRHGRHARERILVNLIYPVGLVAGLLLLGDSAPAIVIAVVAAVVWVFALVAHRREARRAGVPPSELWRLDHRATFLAQARPDDILDAAEVALRELEGVTMRRGENIVEATPASFWKRGSGRFVVEVAPQSRAYEVRIASESGGLDRGSSWTALVRVEKAMRERLALSGVVVEEIAGASAGAPTAWGQTRGA